MARQALPLRALSPASAVWYGTVAAGWALFALALTELSAFSLSDVEPALVMAAVLLVVLELVPLVQGRGHDPEGVTTSTAFVLAILFGWGLWPAVVANCVASIVFDIRKRKSAVRTVFNVGQFSLCLGAASLVMTAAGVTPTLAHPLATLRLGDAAWIAGACVVWFWANLILVSGVRTYIVPFRQTLFDDFAHYVWTTFAVLALSPLVVALAQHAWMLQPLLLIPLLLLYRTAQLSRESEHAAAHDALTGLPNRAALNLIIADLLARRGADQRPLGLMVIDLDDFKSVNDTLGHTIGDLLLGHLAQRLSGSVPEDAHVTRLGGDEFAVVVDDADAARMLAEAERLLTQLQEPVQLEGMYLDLHASVGIARYPDHGADADTLLRLAEVAMYVAKEAHAGALAYSVDIDRNSAHRLALVGELRHAIEHDGIELYYQPKLSARDGEPIGLEALVRWRHARRGFIPPDEFVPLAERSGLISVLTEHVVRLALRQLATWRAMGLALPVAVNVSPSDLVGDRLTTLLTDGLAEHGVDPRLLQLEITERVVGQDPVEVTAVLSRLRAMGIRISLDDFGTGYSSLLRLQALPVDEIKIDRAFVSHLGEGGEPVGIVRAVVDLAHALGVPCVAEGVETEQEWQVLRELGCDGVQGWFVAEPMTAANATAWAQAHTGVRAIESARSARDVPIRARRTRPKTG